MTITAKLNGEVEFTSDVAILHEVKSEYGKLFYHDPMVKSIEILFDGITFLKLEKNDTGKVITRYDMKEDK